jgi:pimeloyl-ACP methyl ester carboxylesterase
MLERPGRDILVGRMNSGLRPAELGSQLSLLLEQLTAGTRPRVVLIGHSMGGLVARAALRSGDRAGFGWVEHCDTLVTLGTPHLGAPLEQAVEVLVRAGAMAPEVDAITRWFDQRSAGVRDLRHGVDDDAEEPGIQMVAAPLPVHVQLHTVGASLPGVRGAAFGDGLVRSPSAHGVGRRRSYVAERGTVLDVIGSHLDLLHAPAITSHVAQIVDDRS